MAIPTAGYGVFVGLHLDNDSNVRTRAARFQAVWLDPAAGAEDSVVDIFGRIVGFEGFYASFLDSTLIIYPQSLDAALQLSDVGFSANGGLLSYVNGANAGFDMQAAFGNMNGGLILRDGGYWAVGGAHSPPSGIAAGADEYGLKVRGIGNDRHWTIDRQSENSGDQSIFLDGWNVQNTAANHTALFGEAHVCTGTFTLTLPVQLTTSGAGDLTIGNRVLVKNDGTGVITVAGAGGTDTVDGSLALLILPGQSRTFFMKAATAWLTEAVVRGPTGQNQPGEWVASATDFHGRGTIAEFTVSGNQNNYGRDAGGIFRNLVSGGGNGADVGVESDANFTEADSSPIVDTKFRTVHAANVRYFLGVAATTLANMVAADAPAFAHIGLGFSSNRADVNYQFVSSDGVLQNVVDTLVVHSTTNRFFLRISVASPTSVMLELLDSTHTVLAEHTFTTNLPAAATGLTAIMGGEKIAAAGAARQIDVYQYQAESTG